MNKPFDSGRGKTLLNETTVTREVTLRIDKYGVYLLFWQQGYMVAGMCFQYPWSTNIHLVPGYSSFSYDAQEEAHAQATREEWAAEDEELSGQFDKLYPQE